MLPNKKMVFLLVRLACATMAQIPFGIGPEFGIVPELVQEEVHAIRSFGALVAVLGHTATADETGAFCHPFDDHIHLVVRATLRIAEDKILRPCLLPLFSLAQTFLQLAGRGTVRSSQFFGVKPHFAFAVTRAR